jgi:hypothetical protein
VYAVFYPLNDKLETSSHLFVLLKTRMQTTLAKLKLTAAYFPPVYHLRMANSESWAVTADICRKIDSVFTEQQTPVLFVLLPASYQVYPSVFERYVEGFGIDVDSVDLEQPNKLLAAAMADDSLELIDPLLYIREQAAAGAVLFGSVDQHFNVDGHRVTAEYLLPIIEERLQHLFGDS